MECRPAALALFAATLGVIGALSLYFCGVISTGGALVLLAGALVVLALGVAVYVWQMDC